MGWLDGKSDGGWNRWGGRDKDEARNPWAGRRHESTEGQKSSYNGRYSEGKSWTDRHGWGKQGGKSRWG
ncbi:MAG TPA: hypothetical protein VE645_18955 [Pseudonocardiaceae bacterium]|jgi:hypothetical protein|nr:hypothetical protein [Pseudonocardiaceae bacterium]